MDPGEALQVGPDASGGVVFHRNVEASFRAVPREHVVLEDDNAGDGVHAASLQLLHEGGKLRVGRELVRADLVRQRHVASVGEVAQVALHVDHHSVQSPVSSIFTMFWRMPASATP